MSLQINLGNSEHMFVVGIREKLNIPFIYYSTAGATEQTLTDLKNKTEEQLIEMDGVIINFTTSISLQRHIDKLQKFLDWQIKYEDWQIKYENYLQEHNSI